MDKKIYHLKDEPTIFDTTEPLIIWTLQIGSDVLAMPEFEMLIQVFYFPN